MSDKLRGDKVRSFAAHCNKEEVQNIQRLSARRWHPLRVCGPLPYTSYQTLSLSLSLFVSLSLSVRLSLARALSLPLHFSRSNTQNFLSLYLLLPGTFLPFPLSHNTHTSHNVYFVNR